METKQRLCEVPDCLNRHKARGMCMHHYNLNIDKQWNAWRAMFQRCTNPNHDSYHNYGGRGINVCDRWKDYKNFVADMGKRPEGMTLDRIDVNGNYEPSNCRWATPTTQIINSRIRSDNSSGYKGVSYHKGHKLWRARINVNGKEKSLGWHKNVEAAIRARRAAEQLYFTAV